MKNVKAVWLLLAMEFVVAVLAIALLTTAITTSNDNSTLVVDKPVSMKTTSYYDALKSGKYKNTVILSNYLEGGKGTLEKSGIGLALDMGVANIGLLSDMEVNVSAELDELLKGKVYSNRSVTVFVVPETDPKVVTAYEIALTNVLNQKNCRLAFQYAKNDEDVIFDNYVPSRQVNKMVILIVILLIVIECLIVDKFQNVIGDYELALSTRRRRR